MISQLSKRFLIIFCKPNSTQGSEEDQAACQKAGKAFPEVVFFSQNLYICVQKAFPAFCEDYFKFFSLNWGDIKTIESSCNSNYVCTIYNNCGINRYKKTKKPARESFTFREFKKRYRTLNR